MTLLEDRLTSAATETRTYLDTIPVPAWETPPHPAPPMRRRILAVAVAAIAVLVTIGGITLWLRLTQTQPVAPTTTPPTSITTTTITTTTVPGTSTTVPPTTTTTESTTTLPPQTAPLTWTRITSDTFQDAEMRAVIAAGPGLIAAGVTGSLPPDYPATWPVVWTSTDGATWLRASLPVPVDPDKAFQGAWIRGIVASDRGIVIAGGADMHAAIWFSPDGADWTYVTDDDLADGAFLSVLGVTALDGTYVAVGEADSQPAVWTSDDGQNWTRVESDTFQIDPTEGPSAIYDVAAGGPGVVAVGTVGDFDSADRPAQGVIWVSPDGVQWERSYVPQETVFESIEADPRGERLLAFGRRGIWASPDGHQWTRVDDHANGAFAPPASSTAWVGDTVVACGPDMALSLWISTDAGTTWSRIDTSDAVFSGYLPQAYGLTLYDSTLVAVGQGAADYLDTEAAVWIGELTRGTGG